MEWAGLWDRAGSVPELHCPLSMVQTTIHETGISKQDPKKRLIVVDLVARVYGNRITTG
jgi:hypothetical protein